MIKEIRWNNRRPFAPFLSAVVPGLGQACTARWGSAATFALLFAIPAAFIIFIPVEPNIGHYIMVPFLVLAWIVNIVDAYRGPTLPTAPCMEACPAQINVPHYISLIVERGYQECHALITRWIPFRGPSLLEVRSGYVMGAVRRAGRIRPGSASGKNAPLPPGRS
jgi:hypothetical protein